MHCFEKQCANPSIHILNFPSYREWIPYTLVRTPASLCYLMRSLYEDPLQSPASPFQGLAMIIGCQGEGCCPPSKGTTVWSHISDSGEYGSNSKELWL
jgi:hypothetical protein